MSRKLRKDVRQTLEILKQLYAYLESKTVRPVTIVVKEDHPFICATFDFQFTLPGIKKEFYMNVLYPEIGRYLKRMPKNSVELDATAHSFPPDESILQVKLTRVFMLYVMRQMTTDQFLKYLPPAISSGIFSMLVKVCDEHTI